ncbi:MAG: Gfo/Idh/MocA family oxidoreductase [Phycisphaeraceae bacterium]|nr:Gfo/Idh/MocA family oxidoreductase [Phycisphaeraceae bacterium]
MPTATRGKTTRYAIVGTGGRASGFIDSIVNTYGEHGQLVGLCDRNIGRVEYQRQRLAEQSGPDVPGFTDEQFDQMIEQTKPDVVVVLTMDSTHHQYIIRALELGCDAVTEKPMTTDDAKCRAIMDAVERTGRAVRVTFNYRFANDVSFIWRKLHEGLIGEVISVDMEYMLDVRHGADYYRRWHRFKDCSGGLLVHKATHHFDLVNWWLDAVPETVFAFGRRAFYGQENAARRGEHYSYDRYTGYPEAANDPFALDLTSKESLRKLYLDNEKYDGYRRDQNVFGPGVTIEDSMCLVTRYRTGVLFSYALNTFLPKEGYHVAFNGTKGRLTFNSGASPHIITGEGSETDIKYTRECYFHPQWGKPEKLEMPKLAKGGHGGADPVLHRQIFDPGAPVDPLRRDAGHEQGAASILVGIAANQSIATGKSVNIADLCPHLGDRKHLSELL